MGWGDIYWPLPAPPGFAPNSPHGELVPVRTSQDLPHTKPGLPASTRVAFRNSLWVLFQPTSVRPAVCPRSLLSFLSTYFLSVLYNQYNVSLVLLTYNLRVICLQILCIMNAEPFFNSQTWVPNQKSLETPHLNFQGKLFLIKLCYLL